MWSVFLLLVVVLTQSDCLTGSYVHISPVNSHTPCMSPIHHNIRVEFGVCYPLSFNCPASSSCNRSCCTDDWNQCMECTGCLEYAQNSFMIVDGKLQVYLPADHSPDLTCSSQPLVGYACSGAAETLCGPSQINALQAVQDSVCVDIYQ